MLKSKKAIFAFAVVLIVMIAFGAILTATSKQVKVYSEIGGDQVNMLNSYSEAEKAKEYVRFSALNAAATTLQELGAKTSTNCFANINNENFKTRFKTKMDVYIDSYKSTNVDLNISKLDYEYSYSITADEITIKCFAQPNIKITSRKIDFTYESFGFVNAELTCDNYRNYGKIKSFVV